ncbi:MAG: hypothetical protein UHK60_04485 [Acutalibacteraceae bacterium]|nr:hypothetical protein [Acutalibacteraceae bacterium]
MKKIITLLMASLIVMSMTACNNNENNTDNENSTSVETSTNESSTNNSSTNNNTSSEATTVGEKLLADFKADSTGTAQEIADRLLTNEVIEFMGAATPVEEGLLSGFDNAEIKGFKEGVMFGPMMSSIAFVGYIFELPEDDDVDAFKTTLKDSANLRWNICVEAEELIVESEGNKVFFLMCPKSLEQPEVEGDAVAEDMDVPAEDMVPAEDGITLE